MASGSRDPKIREFPLNLSGNRKRMHDEEGAEDDIQEIKKRHILFENADRDDDDISLDSDIEALFNEADDDDDAEEVDHEPKQGPVLWSEDQEEYPACAVYHADVKRYQSRVTGLAVNVTDHLSKVRQEGDDLARLYAEAVACQKFPELKKIVIALVGDAGSGKSSLINSILDTPFVSQEGNYGSACTCAITEFRSGFPEQTKKFAAKVAFLDADERRKLLKDHLEEYSYFHFQKDPDWTFQELKEHYAEAQTAECTFLDLFRGKPSFDSRAELNSYLRKAFKNDTQDKVSAQMELWCDEFIAAHCSSSHLFVETDRAFHLGGALRRFLCSSNLSSRESRLWPLVSKVSIGIKGSRVLENLILADMPGLTDISRVRVRASKNYMRSSDHLWIVVPIMRCVSDSGVDSVLHEFGDRFAGRLAMICTKIDDGMKSCSFKVQYPDEAKKMDAIDKRLEEAQLNGNASDEEKLTNLRLKYMVRTRNRDIAKRIYDKRSEHFEKGENGPIFFVSNEHYHWLKGYKRSGTGHNLEQLDPAMTGIPALRRYALSIPAQEVWSVFTTHIQHTSIAFMKSLAIWAARTSADRGDELKRIREKSTMDIDRSVATYVTAVREEAVQSLAGTMRDKLGEVAQKGYDYLQNTVRSWHWMTIKAVVRRGGNFDSTKHGLIELNEKFKQPTVSPLRKKWNHLSSEERKHMATAEKKIKDDLDALHRNLEEMKRLYSIPEEHFIGLINAQKHGITRAVQVYSDNMDKELKNTRQLTEIDPRFGYFAQVMGPTYEEAVQVSGRGYKDTVMTIFEDFINRRDQGSPFIRMIDYASNKVTEHATNFTEELHKECNRIYDEVFNQFGGLMTENDIENAKVLAVKTALREYLPKVDAKMTEIVASLEAIEKRPRLETKRKTTQSDADKIKEEKQHDKGAKVKSEPMTKVKSEIKQEQI